MKKLILFSLGLCLGLVSLVQATDSLYVQGQDAAGWYDTRIRQNSPYTRRNFGSALTLNCSASGGSIQKAICEFTNIDTIGIGKTNIHMYVDLWCETQTGATITMTRYLKPEFEGAQTNDSCAGCTNYQQWYMVYASADSGYGTIGAANASDAGSDNRSNSSGYDKKSTAMFSLAVSDTGSFKSFEVDTAYVRACYEGGFPVKVIFETAAASLTTFTSSESATSAKRPRQRLYWNTAAPPQASTRRIAVLRKTGGLQ